MHVIFLSHSYYTMEIGTWVLTGTQVPGYRISSRPCPSPEECYSVDHEQLVTLQHCKPDVTRTWLEVPGPEED